MDAQAMAAGDRVGPYELVALLGTGAMGEVWRAWLHGPGGFRKGVALKFLRSGRGADPDEQRDLIREARLGALLHHPNVVGTLALAAHDGGWVVALELVLGASTAEILHETGPLPPRALIEVGVQAAAGLAHAHELSVDGHPGGLVHRDVKPGNLLVDRTGFVKVADLGISLLAREEGRVAGTLGYMAPEQAEGRAEPRSDLFSLGATLYRLATGRRPFGVGMPALARLRDVEHLLGSDGFVGPVETAVPGLGAVLRGCLRLDPDDRFPDARRLGDALSALRSRSPEGPSLVEVLARARPGLRVGAGSETGGSDLASTVRPTGNIPVPRDAFVGRTDALRDLEARVARGERLIALLGPGGTGKSRLALEAARRVTGVLPGGSWAVDLCDARSVEGICGALATALELQLERRDPVGQLGRALASRGRLLLVLDNLEQCGAHLPGTLGRWVDATREAIFLCTSRVALGLVGERPVHVPALDEADAAALFAARASRPIQDDEQAEVAQVCAALEGLPLAIELAAARVRLLGVTAVRERLSLSLLSGGRRERPERHRSLEASLDWSAQLLTPSGRVGLAHLAVFEGGFSLEAAEAVIAGAAGEALDTLHELVDASLLRVDAAGRFSMLGVVREYAALRSSPEERSRCEIRHGEWFAQLGAPEAVETRDRRRGEGLRQLLAELDNLVVACRRAVARADGRVALATLRAAWAVLELQGPIPLAAELVTAVAETPALGGPHRAALHNLAGQILRVAGRPDEAVSHLERGLVLHREAGDRRGEAFALAARGILHHAHGRPDAARADYEAALAMNRAAGDRRAEGLVLATLGHLHFDRGHPEQARSQLEAALEVHREVGNRRSEAVALGNLGMLHLEEGRPGLARTHLEQSLTAHQATGHRRGEAVVLTNLGRLARHRGDPARALEHLEAALALHRRVGNRRFQGVVLGHLGNLHHELGHDGDARRCMEGALAVHREIGDRRSEGIALSNLGMLHDSQGRTELALQRQEEALAVHRQVGNRRSEGIVLGNLGSIHLEAGRLGDAAARLDEALAVHEEVGNRSFVGVVLGLKATLAARLGQLEDAQALATRGEGILRDLGDPALLASLLAARAEVTLRGGDAEGAREVLFEARALAGNRPRILDGIRRVEALLVEP